MRRRPIWLLAVTLAAPGAARADAAEPDLSAPAVCAPPCPDGQTCVGSTCVGGAQRTPARAPDHPPSAPPPPAGSAATSGPQADHASGSPPGNTPAPGPAGPPQPMPLRPREGDASPPSPDVQVQAPEQAQAPAPRRRQKRGFLALPYVGMHSYQHAQASDYVPGLRLGGFIGGRFNDTASLNLEVTFDYSNVSGLPAPLMVREWVLDFVVSPLFRVPTRSLELVLGPKAGLFVSESTADAGRKYGYVLGVNAGFFMPVSRTTSLGLLLSLGWKHTLGGCAIVGGGSITSCGIARDSGFASVLGLTAGAMF